MFLRIAVVAAMGLSLVAADSINLINCQNTAYDLPLDLYSLEAVRPQSRGTTCRYPSPSQPSAK